MKKGRTLFIIALVSLPLMINAADRVVVVELGTGTWCGHCPDAAEKARELTFENPGEVLLVEYHAYDNFTNIDGFDRVNFYGIEAYPDAVFDGLNHVIGDGDSCIALYDTFFTGRKEVDSPLEITLERTFDPENGDGTVSATIVNTSGQTVSGKVQFTLTESGIYFPWPDAYPTEDSLHFVNRDMMPDADGEQLTLEPGGQAVLDRDLWLDPEWYETTGLAEHFELGCLMQSNDNDHPEIYQGALLALWVPLAAEVTGTEVASEDGMLHPGQSDEVTVTLKNTGDEAWTEISGVLTTEDPEVEIPDSTGTWGPGEQVTNESDPFVLKLSTEGQVGHRPQLSLRLNDDQGHEIRVDFQLYTPAAIKEKYASDFELEVPSVISGTDVITLSLSNPSRVEMVLIDACGRAVKTIYNADASPGTTIVPLSSRDLPEGAYFVKIVVGDNTQADKLLIIK